MDNRDKQSEIYSLLVTNDNKPQERSAMELRKRLALFSILAFLVMVLLFGYRMNYDQNPTSRETSALYKHSLETAAQNAIENDILMADEFISFMKKHNKKYDSSEETMKRYQAYLKAKRDLIERNKEGKFGAAYGENEMSDWTDEEFQKMLLPKDFYKKMREKNDFIQPVPDSINYEMTAPFPDFFDWRAKNIVTPVKAQGQCGSCWAFAATATVEAAWALAHNGEWRNLSEQTLLDCDFDDNACDGGDEDKAFRFIHRNGLAYAVDLPYVAHRQNSCFVREDWNTTKIEVAYYLHPGEQSMLQWLVNFGPVNIGISVTQPMRAYKGGVFTPDKYACKHEVIGLHSLLVVGFGTSVDTGEKYWIVKNSWGQSWGVENGYVYFARGINACGIEEEPVGVLA